MKWKNYGEESRAVPERMYLRRPPPQSHHHRAAPALPSHHHSLSLPKPHTLSAANPSSLSSAFLSHSRHLLTALSHLTAVLSFTTFSLSPPQLTTLTPFPSLGDLICWFSAPFFSGKGKKKEDKNERKWNLKMLCMANDEKESEVKLFIRVLIWAVRKCLKV